MNEVEHLAGIVGVMPVTRRISGLATMFVYDGNGGTEVVKQAGGKPIRVSLVHGNAPLSMKHNRIGGAAQT